MSFPATTETWQVRPPWRDELTRLRKHLDLQGLRPTTRRAWLWVLVAGDLERLVGYLGLAEDVFPGINEGQAPLGRLEFFLREQWAGGDGARELIQAALRQAASMGLTYHSCQAHPESSFANLLREVGFVSREPQEVWTCPIAGPVTQFEPLVDRMLQRFPTPVTPLREEHLEKIREICTRYKLLTPERIALLSPGEISSTGFSPRFSFIAGDPQNPAAILLARVSGTELYLEVLARNPDAPHSSPAAIAALLKAAMPAARDLGLQNLSCVFRPDNSPEVQRLLERGGGQCVRRFALFVLQR